MALFANRRDAGRRLGEYIKAFAPNYLRNCDALVLALPRGGVPVGYEVARALALPMDVYVVRKLGVPWHQELAMGAVASGGTYVIDEATVNMAGVTYDHLQATLARELAELERREIVYRGDRPEPDLLGKSVILVDDGLATGASMYSAIAALRRRKPANIAIAVPVAPANTCLELQYHADRVLCPYQLERFGAVGLYYVDFEQVGDDEVRRLLDQAERERRESKVA
ncbi:MAG: phosphoribosyltransferase [Candidatus Cybelea sp.]